MRSFTTLASALVLLVAAATVSVSDASPCEDCVMAGIKKTSPTCDEQFFTSPLIPGSMTDKQKSCICPLASADTWLQHCVTPTLCAQKDVDDQYNGFKLLKAEACGNSVAPPPPAGATTTTKGAAPSSSATATASTTGGKSTPTNAGARLGPSSKVAAAGAAIAAVAAVGALL
ncbi:hypothetical protein BGX29_000386 [Mortierella sp. GBA35]|nr:hypothetical protein BGX29_000386 [Mortierella sp. GBA35]